VKSPSDIGGSLRRRPEFDRRDCLTALVRIYMLVGEPQKALDQLEPLLKISYYLSPG
jgi:hypothetical protein